MEKKKLLILGSDYGTLDTVKQAHEMGLHVIVSDTMETSPSKLEADEAWYISTTDIDALVQKCLEEHIDGVVYGASDFNINNGRKLCKRLGLPHYCPSDRAWEVANNKSEFKKVCLKVGAPVATPYYLTDSLSREELDAVQFPVVVKPVDLSGNRGMSYCQNEVELVAGYKKARESSQNSTIVVERMLKGPEFAVNYIMANGEIRLLYFSSEHHQPGQKANLYSLINTTSCHLKQYIDEVNDKVIAVFKEIGCRDGNAWVECMLDEDGHFYLLEMGYRYGGEMTVVPYRYVYNFNTIKFMIEIALGIKHTSLDLPNKLDGFYSGTAASYFLFAKKDGVIEKIEGLDKINAMHNTIVDIPKREGNNVRGAASMGIIRIFAKDAEELCETIGAINNCLKITDKEGENMFIYFDDFVSVIDEYNEGIKEWNI